MSNILKSSLKLFFALLFAAFAGMMLFISFGVIFADSPDWVMPLFTQLFGITVVITMVWQTVYNIGFKDSNMVKTGHMAENRYKGFIIGALAQIPFFMFLVLSWVFNIGFGIYRFINGAYFWFVTVIAGAAAEGGASVGMRDLGLVRGALLILPLLIAPAVSGFVYILGYKGVDIRSKLLYKETKGE